MLGEQERGSQGQGLHMTLAPPEPLVPVTVGGKRVFLLVDTGATLSVLSKQLAPKSGYISFWSFWTSPT